MTEGKEIFKAMTKIMAEVDSIGKNQKNQAQKFNFRGIDDVYNAIHPLLAKHKVFTAPEVLAVERQERTTKSGSALMYRILTIKYHFIAEDGSEVTCTVIGEGMDSGDKGSNKAMSVGHKYAILQMFCIPTDDIAEPDKEVHEVTGASDSQKSHAIWEKIQKYVEVNKTYFNEKEMAAVDKIPNEIGVKPLQWFIEKYDAIKVFVKSKQEELPI